LKLERSIYSSNVTMGEYNPLCGLQVLYLPK
jgi:hypothetical protein